MLWFQLPGERPEPGAGTAGKDDGKDHGCLHIRSGPLLAAVFLGVRADDLNRGYTFHRLDHLGDHLGPIRFDRDDQDPCAAGAPLEADLIHTVIQSRHHLDDLLDAVDMVNRDADMLRSNRRPPGDHHVYATQAEQYTEGDHGSYRAEQQQTRSDSHPDGSYRP